jgi:hypothetical protein
MDEGEYLAEGVFLLAALFVVYLLCRLLFGGS